MAKGFPKGHIVPKVVRDKIRIKALKGRKIPIKEICDLYEKGESTKQISEKTKFTPTTINRYLREQGIKIRTISEQRNLGIKLGRIITKKGKDSPNYKTGIHIRKRRGYIRYSFLQPDGSRIEKFEHRIIWEKHNGKIPNNYSIHHLNGIRDDNRIENLTLLPNKIHNWDTILQPYKDRIKDLEKQIQIILEK